MKKIIYLIFAAVSVFAVSCSLVDSSEIAIKHSKFGLTDKGELKAEVVSGYTTYNPFTESIYKYPVNVQNIDYPPFEITAKGGGVFTVDVYLSYSLMRDKAINVFSKYRVDLREIEDKPIRNYIYNNYKDEINKYAPEEIVDRKAEIELIVENNIRKELEQNGFMVDVFTSSILPPPSLTDMINAKNKAVQSALTAENEVKTAEAQAKISVAKANGEATALKIKADGEAYYNRTVAASLNGLLIEQYAIEKWDGKLPQYTTNSVPFINLK